MAIIIHCIWKQVNFRMRTECDILSVKKVNLLRVWGNEFAGIIKDGWWHKIHDQQRSGFGEHSVTIEECLAWAMDSAKGVEHWDERGIWGESTVQPTVHHSSPKSLESPKVFCSEVAYKATSHLLSIFYWSFPVRKWVIYTVHYTVTITQICFPFNYAKSCNVYFGIFWFTITTNWNLRLLQCDCSHEIKYFVILHRLFGFFFPMKLPMHVQINMWPTLIDIWWFWPLHIMRCRLLLIDQNVTNCYLHYFAELEARCPEPNKKFGPSVGKFHPLLMCCLPMLLQSA